MSDGCGHIVQSADCSLAHGENGPINLFPRGATATVQCCLCTVRGGAGPGAALSAAAAHLRNFILDTRLQSVAGPGPGHTRTVSSELQHCENSQT